MEIGLIYSSKDPRQAKARDFVYQYIKDHGILARVVETERPVQTPTITVDGCCINDSADKKKRFSFPSFEDIAAALEERVWSL